MPPSPPACHPWTPPAPQGVSSRPALGSRLPPSVRSRRPPAVGPDEFRGPAPDHNTGCSAPGKRGLRRSRSDRSRHPRLSPSQPVEALQGRPEPLRPAPRATEPSRTPFTSRPGSRRRRAVDLAAAQQRPGDPRQLVRDRGHDDVERPPPQQRVDPGPEPALAARADRHQRPGAVHELPPQVAVTPLAHPEQPLLAATRALSRDQPQPRCEVPGRR